MITLQRLPSQHYRDTTMYMEMYQFASRCPQWYISPPPPHCNTTSTPPYSVALPLQHNSNYFIHNAALIPGLLHLRGPGRLYMYMYYKTAVTFLYAMDNQRAKCIKEWTTVEFIMCWIAQCSPSGQRSQNVPRTVIHTCILKQNQQLLIVTYDNTYSTYCDGISILTF